MQRSARGWAVSEEEAGPGVQLQDARRGGGTRRLQVRDGWREGAGCSGSWHDYNKVPQTWRLKTINVYSLTVLEAMSLKSRCGQGHVLSQGSRGGSCLASSNFWRLPAILGTLGLVAALLQSLIITCYFSVYYSVCPLLILRGHQPLGLVPTLILYDLILT